MRRPGGLALLALAACTDPTFAPPCPGDGGCRYAETYVSYETSPPYPVDLLVVMDDSASMASRQDAVVARLAPLFERFPAGVPEVRVRVISSTVPTPGLAGFPGCVGNATEARACMPSVAGYLEATQICGLQPNYSGSFADAFACFLRIGTTGCGWEQPLAAARAALEGDPQDGSRFLRKDAVLALVIITDEDDCSAPPGSTVFGPPPSSADDPALAYRCRAAGLRCALGALSESSAGTERADCVPAADGGGLVPVGDYVSFFRSLKLRDQLFIATVLAGPPWPYALDGAGPKPRTLPLCASGPGPVLPAARLGAFVLSLGWQGQFLDLCAADQIDGVFHLLAETQAVKLGYPCLPEDIVDGDPARPGRQPICVVSEDGLDAAGQPTAARPLPSCESGAGVPCWLTRDDSFCVSPQIDRGGCYPPAGTRTTFRCATQP